MGLELGILEKLSIEYETQEQSVDGEEGGVVARRYFVHKATDRSYRG